MAKTFLATAVGFLTLMAALSAPMWCSAQDDGLGLSSPLGKSSAVPKPRFTTKLTPETANPGEEVTLAISVKLPKGYYIYSTTGDFGGRTKIDVEAVGLEAVDAEFQPDHEPKTGFDKLLNAEVGKFFDQVTWSRKYRVKSETNTASITGELEGQYCSGPDAKVQQCIPIAPPYEFSASVAVIKGDAEPSKSGDIPSTEPDETYVLNIQPTRKVKGDVQPTPIAYRVELSPRDAQPGGKVTLAVTALLKDNWHTFSLTQEGFGGSPTVIELGELRGLKALGDGFVPDQPPEIAEQAGLRQELYHHEATWRREFEVLPNVSRGAYAVSGDIMAQYCNPQTCNQVEASFAVGAIGAATGDVPPDNIAAAPAKGEKLQDKGLIPFLLLCFGGGFLALLTPCSFPMVPITVSFFLKQSELQHKRPWLLAIVYCGTIVAAFTILGVGIAAIFGATKLNDLANIGWLNFVIGAVFVAFALNMLGVFDIHMPGWLLTVTASKESAGSYLGAVFMALTFTLTSFTCTFAIAGSLLVGAAQGDVYWPVIGMLAFGTAFAAPFFVLALVPGLLKQLPKSGGWMNSVKVVMGLLELGAAIKFFSIADPAQVLFEHVVVMLIWFVLALITATYLFGWFRLPHDTATETISPWRMLLGTGFFVLAGLLMTGIAFPDRGGFVVRQILAFAPAKFEMGGGALGPSLNHHGLEFALYLDKAIPIAEKENRPLLVDFTGVNCANCREMEIKMGTPEWKQRIAKYVGVQLYVDTAKIPTIHDLAEGKRLRSANVKLQQEWFGDVSMPSYAVVTPDGETVLASYIGKESIPGTFVRFLDEGWAKWQELQAARPAAQPGQIRLADER